MELHYRPDNKKDIKYRGFRKKVYIFIVCFVIAAFIWILIKLSKEYTEVLVFPVSYTNIPAGKVIANDPDTTLTLQLKSKGFKILSNKKFFEPRTITIDVGSLIHKKKNSTSEYYIPASELYSTVGNQIHYPNEVISINPDTLFFHLEKVYSKRVPVKLMTSISFAQQYELADSIKYDPGSVIISGPRVAIDSIKFIETVPKVLSNLNSTQTLILNFNPIYGLKKVTIYPTSEKILIPVDKFTEAAIDLPILIINNTNNYVVRTFPEKVRITYLVSLTNFKNVKPSMFSVVADISKSLLSKSKKLKVEVLKYPSFVRIQKIEPDKIEFILLK
jgi:YbbR domain-containing protein